MPTSQQNSLAKQVEGRLTESDYFQQHIVCFAMIPELFGFKALPPKIKGKIAGFLPSLQDNPYPKSCKRLKGTTETYRIRFGDYRLIYEVHKKAHSVFILKCLHRREVYQR
ncbi:MAG: type II toxin-antitoxin system RelE/ParE family toxin [bacterium]